jgi:transposase
VELIVERPAALDVHKAQVTACVRVPDEHGDRQEQIAEFATTVRGLLGLRDWLVAHRVEQVVMEATGVYWKAPWAILEEEFECLLVNARHVKQVPGRKTDVSDAAWLCRLAEAGLLKASFVPPKPVRQLRNLTRFPSPRHLAPWAGQCPGNDQSAGKRRSGKTRNGSKWLDFALEEAAMAAIRVKANYPAAQYQRLRPRRGHKRALGAVKHSLICAIWHMLATGETYRDLGGDFFTNRDPGRQTKRLVKQLERLGHHVTLQEAATA